MTIGLGGDPNATKFQVGDDASGYFSPKANKRAFNEHSSAMRSWVTQNGYAVCVCWMMDGRYQTVKFITPFLTKSQVALLTSPYYVVTYNNPEGIDVPLFVTSEYDLILKFKKDFSDLLVSISSIS